MITITQSAEFSLEEIAIVLEQDKFYQCEITEILWCNERESFIYGVKKSLRCHPDFVAECNLFHLPNELRERLNTPLESFKDVALKDFDSRMEDFTEF